MPNCHDDMFKIWLNWSIDASFPFMGEKNLLNCWNHKNKKNTKLSIICIKVRAELLRSKISLKNSIQKLSLSTNQGPSSPLFIKKEHFREKHFSHSWISGSLTFKDLVFTTTCCLGKRAGISGLYVTTHCLIPDLPLSPFPQLQWAFILPSLLCYQKVTVGWSLLIPSLLVHKNTV